MMIDRREFIRKAGRGLILGGVIAGGGYLLLRPKTGVACDFDFICRDCRQLKSCSLPEADDFKSNSKPSQN